MFLLGDEPAGEERLSELERAGHPVSRIQVDHLHLIGQEFFRWEVAVAAAGSILGVHPFNEPDVQSAKELAKKTIEAKGEPSADGDDEDIRAVPVDQTEELSRALRRWLESSSPGDYIALLAYLPHDAPINEVLQRIRVALRDRTRLATTLGYGPRFLHSTGQIHKGGPNRGLFLQIVDDPVDELPIPEMGHSFRELIRAQALGDAMALRQRARRVVRVDLGRRGTDGLNEILNVVRTQDAS